MIKPRIFWCKPLRIWTYGFEWDDESIKNLDAELLEKADEFCKKLNEGKK